MTNSPGPLLNLKPAYAAAIGTNALSNGTISDSPGLAFPEIGGSQPHLKLQSKIAGKRVHIDKIVCMAGT